MNGPVLLTINGPLTLLTEDKTRIPTTGAADLANDGFHGLIKDETLVAPHTAFRQMAAKHLSDGDLIAADRILSRGLEQHPDNISLATDYAEIASKLHDSSEIVSRWKRVIEIRGEKSPSKAFKIITDTLIQQKAFEDAESVVRMGISFHPADFYLADRLPKISFNAGFTARAISQWLDLLVRFPQTNCATVFLNLHRAYCAEGLLERAESILREGILKLPDEAKLQSALDKFRLSKVNPPSPAVSRSHATPNSGNQFLKNANHEFTAHLFRDEFLPFGQGTVSLTGAPNDANQHIAAMLDFSRCIAPFRDPVLASEVDVFTTWGATDAYAHNLARNLAEIHGKPLLCLEYGFISSLGLAINNAPQHSIIVCPDSIYFDATRPSFLETRLNSIDYSLTNAQYERASKCIESIIHNRITKYNHAPKINLIDRYPANGRKRLLLVDQRFGDNSVDKGLGGEGSFKRMLEAALAMPDYDIIIKLHPDAISGGQGSYLGRLLPDPLPNNLHLIDFDVNPFCLFEVIDTVFVCTSQFGFEALMAGKEVHCFGVPFYAGWGLTHDRTVVPRRLRQRSIEEIFHLFYIEHSRYFTPDRGTSEIEDLIRYIAEEQSSEKLENDTIPEPVLICESESHPENNETRPPLKILIILPSERLGASGRYIQNLACSLCRIGCQVMVLAEGKYRAQENGVVWHPIAFEGTRLAPSVRDAIVKFAPQIIYENGVRSRAQRAALEAMVITNARLAMQSEDDDVQVYETRHGKSAAAELTCLDHTPLSQEAIACFFQRNNWSHTLNVLLDPSFDRWVEPLLRTLCYHLASLHTAIWHPFEQRLASEFGVPTLVVPPVASDADFERLLPSTQERANVLSQYGIEQDRVVFFIGGALYNYSNEYALFLDALNRTARSTHKAMALVVSSGRTTLPISRMARERLLPEIAFADIGRAKDESYMEMLKACDVVCSPGIPDTFNRYRLPSRLVKAMAMAKPVLTCRCGFGESLDDGFNAFLMDGTDPTEWVNAIASSLDEETRTRVGNQGQDFARQHFNSDRVAAALKSKFEAMLMTETPHSLADRIPHGLPNHSAGKHTISAIKLRDRYYSSMQDAIHLVASDNMQLDTVIHLGAGDCAEFDDYCRLGASQVILVEASPDRASALRVLENFDGRIRVENEAIFATSGSHPAFICKNSGTSSDDLEEVSLLEPTGILNWIPNKKIVRKDLINTKTIFDICSKYSLDGNCNLLIVELLGAEFQALKATPRELLRKFRWIAVSAGKEPLYKDGSTREMVESLMLTAGFELEPSMPNFSDLMAPMLFQQIKQNS